MITDRRKFTRRAYLHILTTPENVGSGVVCLEAPKKSKNGAVELFHNVWLKLAGQVVVRIEIGVRRTHNSDYLQGCTGMIRGNRRTKSCQTWHRGKCMLHKGDKGVESTVTKI